MYHLEEKFSGDPAIKVLDFLQSFLEAADINEVSEGLAILLPYFLEGKAKAGLATRVKRLDAKVPRYPAAVQWYFNNSLVKTLLRPPTSGCTPLVMRLMKTRSSLLIA
jgi:hypothetical protein